MIPLFFKSIQTSGGALKSAKPASEKPAKQEPSAKGQGSAAAPAKLDHFAELLGMLAEHRSGGDFGPHNVEAGHHVAFKAGALAGSGQVAATGRDGLTVRDSTNREHRVHWREVTGHFAPEKRKGKQNK